MVISFLVGHEDEETNLSLRERRDAVAAR